MKSNLITACLAVGIATTIDVMSCSTILVGKLASADGSVLMSHSCDGDVMGVIYLMPKQSYPPGTRIPMYRNVPRPQNVEEYEANLRRGYDQVGTLALTHTARSLILGGNVESMTTGGMNEFGLTIAIEFLPMREGLACDKGRVGPNSNHWTTSLIANGLLRAASAREAIQIIGSMVEEYGFLYYRAPGAGVALPIADNHESWLMEIFGPGSDWTPNCGRPGGVWCAQRIPDGEVGCSANRSRIRNVDLNDTNHFRASPNIYSLAESLGLWKTGTPFIWCDVYGGSGNRSNSLREWRALSLIAPSLKLKPSDDPDRDRYPFSVKPDAPVLVAKLIDSMRDCYEGTEFDLLTKQQRQNSGKNGALVCPWGPPELLETLGLKPERTICTPTSGYVFAAQLRQQMPAAIGNILWFAYGPANTSCFVPVYSGVTELPNLWSHPASFTRIDRQQPQWNFRLVNNLIQCLPYGPAMKAVQDVITPAEQCFHETQTALEQAALTISQRDNPEKLAAFLNSYVAQSMSNVGTAYSELVDYLMFRYLVGAPELAQLPLPKIHAPSIPITPGF